MDKQEVLSRLRPIARSAQAPVLSDFADEAREVAQKMRGNNRAAIVMQRAASKATEHLVRVTWRSQEAALDSTRLEWSPATQRDLESVLVELVQQGAAPLHAQLDAYKSKDPGSWEQASRDLADAIQLHLEAAKSHLAFYVDRRRRQEVLSVLSEIEERLFEGDPTGDVLTRVRLARQQTQTTNTNDDQLKESLEVLAQALPAIAAANDVGLRLADLITWMRTY